MKIFGREPAAYVGLVEAALALLVSLTVLNFSAEQVGLIMAVVVGVFGVYTAYVTKDTLLGVGVGLAKAVLALAVGFGAGLTDTQTGAIVAFVSVALAFFQRSQTEPLARGTFAEGVANSKHAA